MATRVYLVSAAEAAPISPANDSGWTLTSILARTRLRTTTISEAMNSVSFDDSDLTDQNVLFRQAKVTFRDGVSGTSFVPTTYIGSGQAPDVNLRLGRSTDWTPTQPVRGIGQRIWLAGEIEAPIMDVKRLRFEG